MAPTSAQPIIRLQPMPTGSCAAKNRPIFPLSGLQNLSCRERELETRMEEVGREYAAARERDDFDVAGVIAGEGRALIHDIPPAGEIVERIGAEAERLIRAHATALG